MLNKSDILKLAIKLLKEADNVLFDYWYRIGDDGEDYNNDEVIYVDKKIQKFLKDNGDVE